MDDPQHDRPPSSIFKCDEDGSLELDFQQVQLLLDAQEHEDDETDDVVLSLLGLNNDDSDDEEEDEEQPTPRPSKKSRRATSNRNAKASRDLDRYVWLTANAF